MGLHDQLDLLARQRMLLRLALAQAHEALRGVRAEQHTDAPGAKRLDAYIDYLARILRETELD